MTYSKYKFICIVLLNFNILFSQNNIIPNGNFESTFGNNCSISGDFDNSVSNWKEAKHGNDEGVNRPLILDYSDNVCQGLITGNTGNFGNISFCSVFNPQPSISGSTISFKFARIKADYKHKCKGSKQFHDAIAVSLNNGSTFDLGQSYIIRYKINPIRATVLGTGFFGSPPEHPDDCIADGQSLFFSHTRFFLSSNGPKTWNSGSFTQQELINVNFTKLIPSVISGTFVGTNCNWQQVERKFTPFANNFTTLVIYAENGGAFIDDVEVFKECESSKYIQNKFYDNVIYGPNAIDGYNFTERAGSYLYAGKNVTSSVTQGNILMQYSKINYTAGSEINLLDGFNVDPGSDFTALILPCPNNFNRLMNNEDTNPDPNYVVLPPLLSDEESEKLKENDENDYDYLSSEVKIYPNPSNGLFEILLSSEAELPSSIIIQNVLGQVIQEYNINITYSNKIDLKESKKGIYFAKINYSNCTITKKIIYN